MKISWIIISHKLLYLILCGGYVKQILAHLLSEWMENYSTKIQINEMIN